MREFPDNHFDSVVTDPPYGLNFMGKKWDADVPSVEVWAECLRVLKPGGYLLAFGGSRTYHRLVCRIEDAGFVIHPMLGWIFGTGFPKATRVDLEGMDGWRYGLQSLKPALEPICMAQKPMSERTGTANVARWGTGAVNIDACRVEWPDGIAPSIGTPEWGGPQKKLSAVTGQDGETVERSAPSDLGRWPANVAHDGSEEVLAEFPDAPGQQAPISSTAPSDKTSVVYGRMKREGEASANAENQGAVGFKMRPGDRRLDISSAARFFYCAKPTNAERNMGCEHLPKKQSGMLSETSGQHITRRDGKAPAPAPNNHPTVKPIALMRWLCRLVTPTGGLILDPYCGSGSTLCAADAEGFQAVGIELDEAFAAIAEARRKAQQPGLQLAFTGT